jgi:peptidyl-prolyl cis-trans isomerase A (cyclophilin A)|mmetsp:Transcript_1194/g.1828  ORF Transcript_1194/g.1828 Transcript_1194/m.1828 type:complete len:262 (-) Transcript_1194:269-1054(-)
MRVKGKRSDGARAKHFFLLFALAFVVVILIKSFGSGSWHSKAANDEEHNLNKIPAASLTASKDNQVASDTTITKNEAVQDSNFVEFVFSNLDGESGKEGTVIVQLMPEWAPLGVGRIKELTAAKFYDECRVFRVIHRFMAQLGINGDPKIQKLWKKEIKDDPVKTSNARGTVTFAMAGPNTRTTQIFFNKVDNKYLDGQGFAPFGKVVSGLEEVIDHINEEYVEKPNQGKIQNRGNEYLLKEFPRLSFIKTARFVSSADVK